MFAPEKWKFDSKIEWHYDWFDNPVVVSCSVKNPASAEAVDTVDDPFWGQSQHSNLEKYHWTDGYGNYVNANDPTYNPSADNPGNWTLMQESK
jgi:hypothetical protein